MDIITIGMSGADFDALCESSSLWAAQCTSTWQDQYGRFEIQGDGPINDSARIAYWIGTNAASMILAREYVKAKGFDVQVLWDTAMMGNEPGGYVLLTDYMTNLWEGLYDGIVIRLDETRRSEWFESEG